MKRVADDRRDPRDPEDPGEPGAGRPDGGPDGVEPPDERLRKKAVDLLCEAFADDVVPVEEFERRVDAAHRARSVGELRKLLADLPGRSLPVPSPASPGSPPTPEGSRTSRPPSVRREKGVRIARAGQVRDQTFLGGVFGGGSRKGMWTPGRINWCVGIMGGVQLDFREAMFPPGVTEVRVVAVCGGVEIIAPPGVRVELDGMAVMGGFDLDQTLPPPDDDDAPVLRVSGWVLMGGAQVQVRRPGETGRDARKRIKRERKALRLNPWREPSDRTESDR